MMRGKSVEFGLAAVGLVSTICFNAAADEAADTATARIFGGDGVLLADSGDCAQAAEKLRRAETLHHAPTTAARLGECEIAIGQLVAGTERLTRVIREPLPAGSSPASVAAIARARTVLEQALPRIPTIRLAVLAPTGTKITVTLDGEVVPEATLGGERPADPRSHRVQVNAEGFLTATKEFSLSDGEAKRISLTLEADPNAHGVSAPDTDARLDASSHGAPSPGLGPATIVALAVTALGLSAGIGGGIAVADESSDLSKTCNSNRVCPMDKQSEISSAKTWATVSTVGFAVGAVGLGTTVVLLLKGNKETPKGEARGPFAVAQIGPTYVGFSGRF